VQAMIIKCLTLSSALKYVFIITSLCVWCNTVIQVSQLVRVL
jgi:hypothetical protein